MDPLALVFGAIVGLSLGLTGGGGAIFAVPLLVYGLHVAPRDAVGVSLAAVGATSLVGFLTRWRAGQVEIRTGLLFAAAGMLGAPAGAWIAGRTPEPVLLGLFALLMIVVAVRLWRNATAPAGPSTVETSVACRPDEAVDGPTCRRDSTGRLLLNSRCAILLLFVGLATGLLSGLFGVGGGFIIVPALVLFSRMSLQRAVGTSLLVVSLVGVSGVASHLAAGRTIDPALAALFVIGGVAGLFAGQSVGRRLSPVALQKTFVVAILLVACFVVLRSLTS